jgi:hypothetical protein
MAFLIEAGITSQNFVSFFWSLGPNVWSKIWKSFFVVLTKSWTLYVAHEEGCFHAQHHCWTSAASTNVSHILAVTFFSLEICIPYTCQLRLHSTTWLDWMCQVCLDSKHYMWTVRIHCALMWTRLKECVPHIWMTSVKRWHTWCSGVILLVGLYAFMAWTGPTLHLPLLFWDNYYHCK